MKKKKRIQIVPKSEEISFAYAPKTGKKFFMRKDEDMPKLIEVLQDEKISLMKRNEVIKILKSENMSDDGIEAIEGALKILLVNKDNFPKGILTKIAKAIPEYGTFADPCVVVDEDVIRKDERSKVLLEIKKDGKDIETMKVQIVQLQQDLKESNSKLLEADLRIAKAEAREEFVKIRQDLIDSGAIGNIDETAKMIQEIKKDNEDLANKILAREKTVAGMVQALGIEDNIGRIGGGKGASDPFRKIEKLVQDKMKDNPELKYGKALSIVKEENPELIQEYQKNRR